MHPFFIKISKYQKRVSLLTRSGTSGDREEADRLSREIPAEIMQEAERLHEEMKAAGKIRHRALLAILGAENYPPGTVISQGDYMFHWLCWFRYGKTAEQLVREYDSGSLKAAKQVHKLSMEYDQWRFGQLDPNNLKFKTDVDHFDLMTSGLDLGLENLTALELSSCFDELCPCSGPHVQENLVKLRARILKAFPPLSEGSSPKTDP
ncbi:MAG: hypothetical protein LAO19_14195 [Acidobacteriia bacterium]|nr:hypothetical protein [Terriglobia bacterium]